MPDDEPEQQISAVEGDLMRDAGIPVEEPTPSGEPSEPVQPAIPSVDAQLQEMREAIARLEGENKALRDQAVRPPAQPEPTPYRPVTPDAIEQAWQEGKITDAERIGAHAELRAKQLLEDERTKDRQTAILQASQTKISTYLKTYPRLQEPTSEEFVKVSAKLNEMEDEGWNRQDPRVQARALELALGTLKETLTMPTREYDRLRRPVGGGGGQPTVTEPTKKPKSVGEALWERITPDYQQDLVTLRGSKEAAIKTLGYADEARLRRRGLLTR